MAGSQTLKFTCAKKKKKNEKKRKEKNYARAIKPNPQNLRILTRKLDP
jgi:hypothetical protein